jgi:hypothetical protein
MNVECFFVVRALAREKRPVRLSEKTAPLLDRPFTAIMIGPNSLLFPIRRRNTQKTVVGSRAHEEN